MIPALSTSASSGSLWIPLVSQSGVADEIRRSASRTSMSSTGPEATGTFAGYTDAAVAVDRCPNRPSRLMKKILRQAQDDPSTSSG
jgi:hypothetical protein